MTKQQALNQLRLMQAWHEDNGNGPNADYDAICYAIGVLEAQPEELDNLIKALEAKHKKLREMQKEQPHAYRGVTLNDVMMYFDSLEGNEDAWTEFCSCLECRGWGLYYIRPATDKNVGTKYDELEIVRAISGLTEWQKHVQTDSNIDRDITIAIEALKEQLGTNLAEVGTDTISRQAAIDGKILIQRTNGAEIYSDEAVPVAYLKALPPAQPEIIRCRDCKQFRRWIDTDICFCDITESEISDDDFCSRAERRTDGTD